ncbi:hypothetical protein PFLUV_G00242920 [Perca fluviatilis]|uniref:FERM C-terminal PH-like domain-containing protein n=1 Tax=Perca fluviatilis TaxID=8168 RepID=A0A6A5DQ09_PERFL|nr:hypothetical protein PFLUV_G00242920 [Perca fluviatilis]
MRTRQKRQVCILLPNKQHLDCTVRVRARGHEVLNSVLKHLGVSELQVFGLAVLRDNEYLFLESAQKLSKYFGKRWNRASSTLIKRRGRDFLLQHCPVLHVELRGVTRSQAVLQFIKEASSLQDGPVTFYRMRQEKKELRSSILLGVAMKGVHIYQGSRFEIAAVGSLCLPKLVYYTPSATHSKHILRHLSDSHRFHIITRDAVGYIQQLEDMQASHFYKEAYICDTTRLAHRLQSNRLTSSISDCSVAVETTTAWSKEEEEEEDITEFELCVDEPEELFVDSPAELSWLAELSVDGPLVLPSSYWAAVTMEMKQVLKSRADDEGVSMD